MSFAAALDPGILRSALLPALQAHTALAIPFYALSRLSDRYEAKDLLWALSPALVAWYTAVGRPWLTAPLPSALSVGKRLDAVLALLTRADRLLLTGVTLWGARLAYRIVSRSIRRGADDPRYDTLHEQGEQGWNAATYQVFLPEILAQTAITLPFTLLHNAGRLAAFGVKPEWRAWVEGAGIGLWAAAFGMEVLADWQLARHQKRGEQGLCKDGVWSVVRHPNYLADFLLTASYPLILLSHGLLNPYHLLSPLTNYLFLRHVGGDAQTEAHQEARYLENEPAKMLDLIEMRETENAFWPGWSNFVYNRWGWAVVGLGVAGWAAERAVRI